MIDILNTDSIGLRSMVAKKGGEKDVREFFKSRFNKGKAVS